MQFFFTCWCSLTDLSRRVVGIARTGDVQACARRDVVPFSTGCAEARLVSPASPHALRARTFERGPPARVWQSWRESSHGACMAWSRWGQRGRPCVGLGYDPCACGAMCTYVQCVQYWPCVWMLAGLCDALLLSVRRYLQTHRQQRVSGR